jgi:hypothetical protein
MWQEHRMLTERGKTAQLETSDVGDGVVRHPYRAQVEQLLLFGRWFWFGDRVQYLTQ